MNEANPSRSRSRFRAPAITRNPALLMNVSWARSNTSSLTGPASSVASWVSNCGAVAVSRLPASLTVAVRAVSGLLPVWIWITSGIIISLVWFCSFQNFISAVDGSFEVFDQKQNVFISFAPVANGVGVATDDLDAPASAQVVVGRRRGRAAEAGQIKLRTAIAQLNQNAAGLPLDRHAKLFSRVIPQRVRDDVAAALLERQRQAVQDSVRHLFGAPEFLQRFHRPHHFLRRRLQFHSHSASAFPSWGVQAEFTFKARIAISSDCGAVPANARTSRSN